MCVYIGLFYLCVRTLHRNVCIYYRPLSRACTHITQRCYMYISMPLSRACTHITQRCVYIYASFTCVHTHYTVRCVYIYNNNNEYLERLTHTGPKRLHILYKYILSKFNAYNLNAHKHAKTYADSHTYASVHTHTYTHAHTPVTYQGNETEVKVFKKKKVFKED